MSVRDIIRAAVNDIAAHLGENVTIDGHCVSGVPRIEEGTSAGLSTQVHAPDAIVSIRTSDARRININKGMDVHARGKDFVVVDFLEDNFGWTTIELQ